MYKYIAYYSVKNGGDGSAYPRLFESLELAAWDQEHMSEGWGEDCTGSFEFESESPITCLDHVITKGEVLCDMLSDVDSDNDEEIEDFIEQFYDGVMPCIDVEEGREYYSNMYVNDVFVGEFWTYNLKAEDLMKVINDTISRIWGT